MIIRPASLDIARFRDFGEILWKAARKQGWGAIDLVDIDRAISELTVRVSTPSAKHIAVARQKIEHHLNRCMIEGAEIVVVED